jgi:predicted membrane-bound dolichyl-phosphate-mannose-protein mannosyltransferase
MVLVESADSQAPTSPPAAATITARAAAAASAVPAAASAAAVDIRLSFFSCLICPLLRLAFSLFLQMLKKKKMLH